MTKHTVHSTTASTPGTKRRQTLPQPASPGDLGACAEVQGAHGTEHLDAAHVLRGESTGQHQPRRAQLGATMDPSPLQRAPLMASTPATGGWGPTVDPRPPPVSPQPSPPATWL